MVYSEPVLICPGVIKCGTTLLYEILRRSPKVNAAKNKEVHFFSYALERDYRFLEGRRKSVKRLSGADGINEYLQNFDKDHGILCDVSPSYLGHPGFISRVGGFLEQPYFLVMTRDRMERAKSSWMHAKRAGLEREDFYTAVYRDFVNRDPTELPLRKYFQLADYDSLIRDLEDQFGPERVATVRISRDLDTKELVKVANRLLKVDLFEDLVVDGVGVEDNSARGIGEHQMLVKWIFDSPELVSLLSKMVPRSQKLRRFLARLIYRGKIQEYGTEDDEKVANLFLSEFGSL